MVLRVLVEVRKSTVMRYAAHDNFHSDFHVGEAAARSSKTAAERDGSFGKYVVEPLL